MSSKITHPNKEIKRAIKYALAHGFTVEHGRHFKLRKGLDRIIVSSSPSCKFAAKHVLEDINKILNKESDYGSSNTQ